MKKNLQTLFLALITVLTTQAQVTLNDVTLPAKITKDNTSLSLNGGGIRKKAFFKLYTAGLYTGEKSKNGTEIMNADKPVAIQLTITSSLISSDNMSEAIQEGFETSMKGNTTPLKDKIASFINTFKKEEIKEGDVFEIWYVTGTGVKSYKNQKLQSTIAGLDFKKALFGIWLSDTPVDADLKKGLLGQ